MKKFLAPMAVILGVFALSACQSTSNTPNSNTTSAACVTNSLGQSINPSTGGLCASTSSTCGAAGTTYNSATGQWINTSTGQVVYCSTGIGTGVGTGTGIGIGTGIGTGGYSGGCSYYDQVYPGNYYVPEVDPTTGILECVNLSYGQYSSLIGSGYNYSTPVYSCPYAGTAYEYMCYGSSQYGYGSSYYGSGGGSTCIGGSDDEGDSLGICF